jgi:tetratricopeptide (TPR) repeat protein
VLAKLGEDVPAYQALRRAHELNPQDAGAANLLYATLLKLARKSQDAGRYAESLRYFSEAANLRPDDPEPHRGIAEVYALSGRPNEATAEQKRAERLSKGPERIP